MNHVEILRQAVERIRLDQKCGVSEQDKKQLVRLLHTKDKDLASHIEKLSPTEIEDLIVNTVYG